MINHEEHAQLVAEAQLGDKESLNRLAEVARVYLYEYVLRLTLQKDLTQDIVQECILEMFKVFHKLKNAEKFWSWLDGIAFNKIRSHYGRKWRHKTISLSEIGSEIATEDSQSALADIINRELKQIVVMSMRELAPRQRAVLTMRCYKGMPYSEIATVLGCTEFGAQSLFYRAKKSLAKKLANHGLGKGSLLTALVVFGKLTAATEATAANITVTAATLKVSTAAALMGVVTSKTAVVSLLTAGAITVGTIAVNNGTVKINSGPQNANAGISVNAQQEINATKSTEQFWYFFPEGAGKPVMLRLLKLNDSGQISHCQYLQNQHANYYYDNGIVYIKNSRMYNSDLSVSRLPTDNEDLSEFISRV
jgi:RNA polymerase sigma-70 factor (ECF subfamily)